MSDLIETKRVPGEAGLVQRLMVRLTGLPAGLYFAAPIVLFLLLFFVGPLFYISGVSVMPTGSTELSLLVETADEGTGEVTLSLAPTLDSFARILEAGYLGSFWISLQLACLSTAILLLLCYPLAYGLSKVFGRMTPILTLFFLMPLFVSETIRLYGWTLFFLKGGILSGLFSLLGISYPEIMYSTPVIVLGLVNIYFPFMLFPLVLGISLIDDRLVLAAQDLGASRWTRFTRIELPLAKPGLIIGILLTFVLTLGSMSESQILGGQSVMMIAHSIDFAFSWQQDWPLGAALSVLLILFTGVLMLWLLSRIDFDELFRRR